MRFRHLMILVFSCILLTACANDMNNPAPQDTSPVPTVSVEVSEAVTKAPTLAPTKKPIKTPTRTPTPTVTPRPILHGGVKEEIIKNSLEIVSVYDYEMGKRFRDAYCLGRCGLFIDDYMVFVRDYKGGNDPKTLYDQYDTHVFFTTLDNCEFWLYVDMRYDGGGEITLNRVSKEDFLIYEEHYNYFSSEYRDQGLGVVCDIWIEGDEIVCIQEIYSE